MRRFRIDPQIYGRQIDSVNAQNIGQYIYPIEEHSQQAVTLCGIAAKRWRRGDQRYTLADLQYHFEAIHLACHVTKNQPNSSDAPTVFTGAWGCGAFNNSAYTIVLLQMLAALVAKVRMVFTGIDNSHNSGYTPQYLKQAATWLKAQMQTTATINTILEAIEKLQTTGLKIDGKQTIKALRFRPKDSRETSLVATPAARL